MIVEKPKVIADGLYNQRQAAEALKVDRHTIARYEADGLILFRVRKAGKAKVTTGQQILKCWQGMII
ncbi:MAG: hypothetical protein K5928_00215 [Prevotella sp.]|nr:hypothetical protein [Prevotella sp.]